MEDDSPKNTVLSAPFIVFMGEADAGGVIWKPGVAAIPFPLSSTMVLGDTMLAA